MLFLILQLTLGTWQSAIAAEAPEATLGRLSFWVPPERMGEFEEAYREKIVPILNRHGFRPAEIQGRATPDSVFSRLFAFDTPAKMAKARSTLILDPAFIQAGEELGSAFGTGKRIKRETRLYSAPAGPGKSVIPRNRVGQWRNYDVTDGLGASYVHWISQDRVGNLWFSSWHQVRLATVSAGLTGKHGRRSIPRTAWLTTGLGRTCGTGMVYYGWAHPPA